MLFTTLGCWMMDGTMHDETVAWLSLSLVPGLGARGLYKLVDRFGSAQAILHASPADIGAVTGLREEVGRGLHDSRKYIDQATAELHRLTRIGGRFLTFPDPAYPDVLRHLSPPPPILFVRGDVDLLHRPMAALVGTRAATSYGRRMAASLAGALAGRGVAIVSGMAAGIDTAAHQGCLSGAGATVGVLGCGLNVVYPRSNRRLFDEVLASGALVSEYPLDTQPEPFRFPARNRIIAGLARAIVVIEAGAKSGALITVQYGLEAGREIFAVPGQADSFKSQGAHWLIKQGAGLATCADDILACFDDVVQQADNEETAPARGGVETEGSGDLLAHLEQYPLGREEVLRRSGLSSARLSELLLLLELDGVVELLPGNMVRRVG